MSHGAPSLRGVATGNTQPDGWCRWLADEVLPLAAFSWPPAPVVQQMDVGASTLPGSATGTTGLGLVS